MLAHTTKISREGLTVLDESSDDQMDIVFVHGLKGHPQESWTHDKTGFYWPNELSKRVPGTRIMTYGYKAEWKGGGANLMGVAEYAGILLLSLRNVRKDSQSKRPLIFICHSMGGLVVKKALITCSKQTWFSDIFKSTKVVFFFGTPHKGSHILDHKGVSMLEKIGKAVSYEIPSNLRPVLKTRSDELFGINIEFAPIIGNMDIVNFYEELNMKPFSDVIVDKDSATMQYNQETFGLARDHQNMVRYTSSEDDVYLLVSSTIKQKLSHISKTSLEPNEDFEALKTACLKSLLYTEFDNRMSEITSPSEDTFNWVWEPEVGLNDWMNQKRGLFWIGGKPGSGKSTLMKEILLRSQRSRKSKTCIIAGYFFSNNGSELERSLKGMLQSLLIRLLKQDGQFFPPVLACYEEKRENLTIAGNPIAWDLQTLKSLLQAILQNGPSTTQVCLFIDALDECEDSSSKELISLFNVIVSERSTVPVKICFSGRSIPPNLVFATPPCPGFLLEDMTMSDISLYVSKRMSQLELPSPSKSEELALKSNIIERADGIFLWVDLVFAELERGCDHGNSMSWLQDRLSTIPNKLSGIFTNLLDKIEDEYIDETNSILAIMLAVYRPLTLSEFYCALFYGNVSTPTSPDPKNKSTHPDPNSMTLLKYLRSRCGGLLEAKDTGHLGLLSRQVDDYSVQFIHQTVKDFLLEKPDDICPRIISSEWLKRLGHEILSRSCVRYLQIREIQSIPILINTMQEAGIRDNDTQQLVVYLSWHFLKYALYTWPFHFRDAEKLGSPQADQLESLGQADSDYFETWRMLFNWQNDTMKFKPDTTPMSIAVGYNMLEFARRRIKEGADVNIALEGSGHYLHLAASRGHAEMVKLLLRNRAEIDARGGLYESALQAAASTGSQEVVEILLRNGADLSIQGGKFDNALFGAFYSDDEGVIELLLNQDYDSVSRNWVYGTALMPAAFYGHDKTVISLLSHGVDFNSWDEKNMTALLYACLAGSDTIIKSLVKRGADVTARGPFGLTVLHWACLNQTEDLVQSLIEKGADITAESECGDTMLHMACANSSLGVLTYLLKNWKLDVNMPNNDGHTPLLSAIIRVSPAHVQSLCEAGANYNAKGDDGLGVLHLAMLNKNARELVEKFLNLGLNINARSQNGTTPLHLAAEFADLSTVTFLVEKGADLQGVDEDGQTILHASATSCSSDCEDKLAYFLEQGLNPLLTNDCGLTALHYSMLNPSEGSLLLKNFRSEMVRREFTTKHQVSTLLDTGIDVNSQDICGTTALHLAASLGSMDLIKILLENGAKREIVDYRGCRPMDLAEEDWIQDHLDPSSEHKFGDD